jgi:ABC-type bacteriocin transporter
MVKKVRIKQRDLTDCGAACLASVAMHYQLALPVSRIRQYAGTDKRGTNLTGLIDAAQRLGFQAKAAKGQVDSLPKIPLPAIAHVVLKNGLQHYVVLYKAGKKKLTYMDPADGEFHSSAYLQFQEIWSGVVLLILPHDDFATGIKKVSNLSRFWQLVQPHSSLMTQALTGALIYTVLGLSTSIYMQKIVDFVFVEGNTRLLNLLSAGMIIILIFQLTIAGYKTIFSLQTGQMIDARLILGYYKHLLQLPQRFFDTMRVGEIISRVNDAVKIRDFINHTAITMFVNSLIVLFSMTMMFFYYWKLALLMMAILPIYILLYYISNRINKKWQRRLMEESAEVESQLVESLNAAGTIKRFALENYSNEKTATRFQRLLRSIYKTSLYSLYIGTSAEFFTRLFTILLLWWGSYFVISRELTAGELLSCYALIGYFTGPASSLLSANKNIQDALIAADRLFEIIDLETETDGFNKIKLTPERMGDISFHNLTFQYGPRSIVFENLSLSIEKGKSTAIVGESGSGKSTLLSLLQNLYPLKEGSIQMGGIDLQHICKKSLRQLVAVVPQHTDLFSGTIIDNIAIGSYEPDMQRILFLSKKLGIDEFIEQLPNTYSSILNEQGLNLSGGQRQRLSIARALYRNPEILILDEATSNLDPVSEQKVQETLDWFKQTGKTIIVITHRLPTIKHCDTIFVLKQGKVVEKGSHHSLLSANGHYTKLWSHQFSPV